MPMTNPGGGASNLSSLGDVAVRNDAGIDQYGFIYNNATGKWIASQNLSVVPTVSTFNPADCDTHTTLSNSNYTATLNATALYTGCRGNTARASGKYYLEYTVSVISNTDWGVGFANSAYVLTSGIASNANYCFISDDGHVHYNAGTLATVSAFSSSNIVGVAIDFGNNAIWFRTGAGSWNNSGTAHPETNTGGLAIPLLTATSLFPLFKASSSGNATVLNTGQNAFANAAPNGFSPWDIFAPQGATVGASPVAFTAPVSGHYVINGGTVSAVTLTRGNAAAINVGTQAGVFKVSQGDILTVTYSVAPTITFIPNR